MYYFTGVRAARVHRTEVKNSSTSELWHRRLGHPSYQILLALLLLDRLVLILNKLCLVRFVFVLNKHVNNQLYQTISNQTENTILM